MIFGPSLSGLTGKIMKLNKTPKQTVRAYCQHCLVLDRFNAELVRDCQGDQAYTGPCPFFPYRLGKRIPVKIFRAFCLQCMGGSPSMVRDCQSVHCLIHSYRFGKNPARIGKGASGEVMEKMNAAKRIVSNGFSSQNQFSVGE